MADRPEAERSKNGVERFLYSNIEVRRTNAGKIRVALIEACSLTRISLTHLLEQSTHANRRSEDFAILPFSNPDELLSCYPDCGVRLVLHSIGSRSPSDDGVHEDINRLKLKMIDVPLIILSSREEPDCIWQALHIGADSYISTNLEPDVVIQALRLIQVGGVFIPCKMLLESFEEMRTCTEQAAIIGPIALQGFTRRQLEVLQLLRKGRSNKIIAYELHMQESTVKVHVRQIMKKLNAINRTHAAFLALQLDGGGGSLSG